MNPVYIHLLLNHIPILGAIFALLLFLYGFIKKNPSLLNAGLVSLVIITLLTIPTYLSGEEAEEIVEDLAGTSEFFLEEHEEWSEAAMWMMVSTGILAFISLLFASLRNLRKYLNYLIVIASLLTVIFMIIVGYYGGRITHDELRDSQIEKSSTVKHNAERSHHDDD